GTALVATSSNPLYVGSLVATSTLKSILPYASTTALTVSGTASTTALVISGIKGSTECLHVDSHGVVTGTGADCGTNSGGAVNSVSNSDGTLSVSPTSGAVVASLNLSHGNIWTALQQF